MMNVEELREYCLSKENVTEGFPFDDVTLVFKTGGKMFAILSLDDPLMISLKCDPAMAVELRERYPSVIPGYHLNKQLWNSVYIDGTIPPSEIRSWIDNSYDLIVESLPKSKR